MKVRPSYTIHDIMFTVKKTSGAVYEDISRVENMNIALVKP